MKRFEMRLDLSPLECAKYYRGEVTQVIAKCKDNTVIQFPALLIRSFVNENGVHGQFVLTCSDDGKDSSLERN